jgi:hypothetical protein
MGRKIFFLSPICLLLIYAKISPDATPSCTQQQQQQQQRCCLAISGSTGPADADDGSVHSSYQQQQ